MANEITYSYVGRAACGCIQAICMDRGDKATAAYLAEFISQGLTIDRVDSDYGKAHFMDDCDKCRELEQVEMFQ